MAVYPYAKLLEPSRFLEELPVALQSKILSTTSIASASSVETTEDLDAAELTILNDAVAAHPVPYKNYQIYNYFLSWGGNDWEWPSEINYITQLDRRLFDKKVRSFGELQSVIYYEGRTDNGDGTFTYDTPVIKETFTYERNAVTGFPTSRTQSIQWYYTDGTLNGKVKIRVKYYDDDPSSAIAELIRVRKTNVLDVVNNIIPLIYVTDAEFTTIPEVIDEGRRFFETYSVERELYENDGNYSLTQAIKDEAADFLWLDNDISAIAPPFATIRSFVIYSLTSGAET